MCYHVICYRPGPAATSILKPAGMDGLRKVRFILDRPVPSPHRLHGVSVAWCTTARAAWLQQWRIGAVRLLRGCWYRNCFSVAMTAALLHTARGGCRPPSRCPSPRPHGTREYFKTVWYWYTVTLPNQGKAAIIHPTSDLMTSFLFVTLMVSNQIH
jgi:hypothetical protein